VYDDGWFHSASLRSSVSPDHVSLSLIHCSQCVLSCLLALGIRASPTELTHCAHQPSCRWWMQTLYQPSQYLLHAWESIALYSILLFPYEHSQQVHVSRPNLQSLGKLGLFFVYVQRTAYKPTLPSWLRTNPNSTILPNKIISIATLISFNLFPDFMPQQQTRLKHLIVQ